MPHPPPPENDGFTLTDEERQTALTQMWRFMLLNGFGFTLLSGIIIMQIALEYHASSTWLGLFSSLLAYAGLIQVFAPRLLGGFSLIKTMSVLWFIRGGLVGLMLLVPPLDNTVKAETILLGIFIVNVLFSMCRSVGGVLIQSVVTGLSTPTDAGQITARLFGPNGYCGVVSSLAAWLLVSVGVYGDSRDLFIAIAVGCALNTAAALLVRSVPYHARIKKRSSIAIFSEVRRMFNNHHTRHILGLEMIMGIWNVGMHMIVGYLGHIRGFDRTDLLLMQVLVYLAFTAGISATRPTGDRFGSRPLLQIGSLIGFSLFVLLAYLPEVSLPVYLIIAFLICGLAMYLGMLVQRLAILYGPDRDQVAFRGALRFMRSLAGIAAGYLGVVCDLAETAPWLRLGGHPYTLLFLTVAASMLVFFAIARSLKEDNTLGVRATVAGFFKGPTPPIA